MTRTAFLISAFLFFSGILSGQDCPSITLSSTTGSTCGRTPITISGNTFQNAILLSIDHNGDGNVAPSVNLESPFSFTYTPGTRDMGSEVVITLTTDIINPDCTPATETFTLTVEPTPREPRIGTRTQPSCLVSTGSVVLSDLPSSGEWSIAMTPGGTITSGSGTSATISGIPAGTYTFVVTSASGCVSPPSNNVVINTQPPSPEPPVVTVNCSPVNSSVTVVSPLGTGLQYRLDGGNYQSGTTFNSVPVGSHTLTVRNSFGCETTGPVFQVSAAPQAPTVGTITQPTCLVVTGSVLLSGLPSGSWTITRLPGGATTNGSGSSFTVTGLVAGTHTFTVTNSAGCASLASSPVIINAPPPVPTAPVAGTITQPGCSVATGSVVLTGLPISGTWILTRMPGEITSTGTGTGATISGLTAGTYTFRVTNSIGCTSVSSGNVVINPQSLPPSAPVPGAITAPTCTSPNGTVVLNGLPSSGSWTVTRTPGNISMSGTGTSTTVSISQGTYTFTVTNFAGCVSPSSPAVIIPASPSTPTSPLIGIITQPRFGNSTGSVVVNGLPATGTWTLTRLPENITTTGTGTTTTVTGLPQGIYSFTVTNSLGCASVASASFQIIEASGSPQVIITDPAPVCAPSTVNITLPEITAGSSPNLIFTYWLDEAATTPFTTPGAAVAGTYYIRGTNPDGFFTISPVIVSVYELPVANAGPDQNLPYVFETRMNANLQNDFEEGVWTITSGSGNLSDITNATSEVTGLALGKNVFLWTVTNGVCPPVADSVSINVGDYGTQTLITPNMDGKNDYFMLKRSGLSVKMELIIFDRRGYQVYKNPDYDNSWNGVNFDGEPLPDDTYFYVANNSDGTSLKGFIVIRTMK